MTKERSNKVQRYTVFNLPSYRYIPGKGLHPSKMKDKVHIPKLPELLTAFSEQNWEKSERYLYAIDLFNLQYYWEVHEVLEKIWLKLGKQSAEGIFLQGLIQLSVALLKRIKENESGFKRLIKKGFEKVHTQSGIFLGIDINELTEYIHDLEQGRNANWPIILLRFEKY